MHKKVTPYMFIAPALFLLAIFNFYPIIETFVLSFMTSRRGIFIFAGIDNYIRLFGDSFFWISVKNSLIYLAVQVPIMTILALALASLLHRGIKRAKEFFRTLFFVPMVVDAVAYSLIFFILFQDKGIINYILSLLNLDPIFWTRQAWPARTMIMIVMTWRWVGYNMIMFLAGMQSIPEDLYESAKLDGASSLKMFWYITLPSLRPIILFSLILSTTGTLNLFSEPYLLTQGGPNDSTLSIGLYIYRQAFQSSNLTYSATISVFVVLLVGTLSAVQLKLGKEK